MSEMQVTTSPTLNWCIAVSPKFDELPRPETQQRLRQKKGRNPPFRWHADRPDPSECRRSQGNVSPTTAVSVIGEQLTMRDVCLLNGYGQIAIVGWDRSGLADR